MQIYDNTAQHRKRVHRADLLGSVALDYQIYWCLLADY